MDKQTSNCKGKIFELMQLALTVVLHIHAAQCKCKALWMLNKIRIKELTGNMCL